MYVNYKIISGVCYFINKSILNSVNALHFFYMHVEHNAVSYFSLLIYFLDGTNHS